MAMTRQKNIRRYPILEAVVGIWLERNAHGHYRYGLGISNADW
jgi:hypothetical protein